MSAPRLPWRSMASAPQDGSGLLLFGLHDRDAPPGASPQVRAGDGWWAIALWDVWRGAPAWVFAKDGAPVWSEPVCWQELTWPEGITVPAAPLERAP